MKIEDRRRDPADFFARYKPALLATYHDMRELLSTFGVAGATHEQLAGRLTSASEYVFVPPSLIKLAFERKEIHLFAETLLALAGASGACARTFAGTYPRLAFPLDSFVSELLLQLETGLLRLRKPEDALQRSLLSGDEHQCLLYLRLFGSLGAYSPDAVEEFMRLYSQLQRRMPRRTLLSWVQRGVDLLTSRRIEDGVRHLVAGTRESRTLLGLNHAVLDDLKGILHIYGSSISGVSYGILATTASSFGLTLPYTDGRTIYLPPEFGSFDTVEQNETAYSALTALLAESVRSGSFGLSFEALPFMDELRERYATVLPDIMEHVRRQYGRRTEAVRERPTGEVEAVFRADRTILLLETPHEKLFYAFPTPDLVRELFAFVEEFRVEAALSFRYAGLKRDFSVLNQRMLGDSEALPLPSTGLGDELAYVINSFQRRALGELPGPGDTEERSLRIVSEILQHIRRLRDPAATVQDSAQVSFEIYNRLYDNYPVIPWCRQNDIRDHFAALAKWSVEPEVAADVSPELFTGRTGRPQYGDLKTPSEPAIDLATFTSSERHAESVRRAILSGRIRVFRYPEYNYRRGRHEPKFCLLYESVLEGGDERFYTTTLKEHEQTYKRLRNRFLMMQPEELEISRRWPHGDEIHLGDSIDFATDLLRGACPDERIYQVRRRNIRDVASAILVDASSSTEETVNGSQVIEIEKAAVSLLSGVLAPIGDVFGIFSYFSMGRHNVFFNVAKDFNESWNRSTQRRIASIEAIAGNRDGCAIRHATSRLLQRQEKTKLLILLSDGIPADAGYGTGDAAKTSEYAIEDTRRAILEARMKGVVPYCITIDRTAKSYISHLYGDYHFTVIDNVSRLPERLSSQYLRLTR